MRRLLLLLASVCALSAGCTAGGDDDDDAGSDGEIAVIVGCSGAACELLGSLRVPLFEDSGCAGGALLTPVVPGVITSTSLDVTVTLSGLPEGAEYCVQAWLDIDTDGTLSSGDAIPSDGDQTATPQPATEITFTLDALQP